MWSVMKPPEPPRRLGGVSPASMAGRESASVSLRLRDRRAGFSRCSDRHRAPRAVDGSSGRARPVPVARDRPQDRCLSVCLSSFAPRLIASSGASLPVQSRKLAAPWWTRTSNPSTHTQPRARAATRQRCAVWPVDEVHHDLPITPFIGRKGQLLEGIAAFGARAVSAGSCHADGGGVHDQVDGRCIGPSRRPPSGCRSRVRREKSLRPARAARSGCRFQTATRPRRRAGARRRRPGRRRRRRARAHPCPRAPRRALAQRRQEARRRRCCRPRSGRRAKISVFAAPDARVQRRVARVGERERREACAGSSRSRPRSPAPAAPARTPSNRSGSTGRSS